MGVLRRVMEARSEWWKAIPDQTVFAGGQGDGPLHNVAARSAKGDWALAYLSNRTTVAIRMDVVTAGTEVEASWIDPATGTQMPIGRFAATGACSFSTPDGWEDAVLVLQRRLG
jgi:hypothetical protein